MFYKANDFLENFKNEVLKVSDSIWMNLKSVRYDRSQFKLFDMVKKWISMVGQIRSYVGDVKLATGCQTEFERLMEATKCRFLKLDVDMNTCLQLELIIQHQRTSSFYSEKENSIKIADFVNAVNGSFKKAWLSTSTGESPNQNLVYRIRQSKSSPGNSSSKIREVPSHDQSNGANVVKLWEHLSLKVLASWIYYSVWLETAYTPNKPKFADAFRIRVTGMVQDLASQFNKISRSNDSQSISVVLHKFILIVGVLSEG
eukprot:238736_1